MSQSFKKIELAVLRMLLDGECQNLVVLRQQLQLSRAVKRQLSGVGFSLTFDIPTPLISAGMRQASAYIGDVDATIKGLKNGAGFVLFIKGGRLSALEGYTYDEPWVDDPETFELRYSDPQRPALALICEP